MPVMFLMRTVVLLEDSQLSCGAKQLYS